MSGNTAAQVRVFPDLEALSRGAADYFVARIKERAEQKSRFAVAISGGSTPKRLYSLLRASPYRDAIPWDQVHFFWADERCVPPDHPESNYKLAFDTFLSLVPAPESNLHRVSGELSPATAALAYEDDLRNFFGDPRFPKFDLIILGVGADGHTASLFPGSPSLRETARLALPVYLERPQQDRVTLTLPVLDQASKLLFLASGRVKAPIVSQILESDNAKRYPAGLVRPVEGEVIWFIDREAARELRR